MESLGNKLLALLVILVLSVLAFAIWFNYDPFDKDLATHFPSHKDLECIENALNKRDVPYRLMEYKERTWMILEDQNGYDQLMTALGRECSAF